MSVDLEGADNTGADSGDDNFPDFSSFSLSDTDSTDTTGDEPTGTEQPGSGDADGDNPKWAPILGVVPEMFHSQIKPLLKEQDRAVNARFQELASERQQYEAYKPFIEQQVTPQQIQQALQITRNLNEYPVETMERLRDHLIQTGQYKAAEAVQEDIEDNTEDGEESLPPNIARQMEQFRQDQQNFFQNVEAQRKAQEQAQGVYEARQQLDSQLASLTQKYSLSPDAQREILQRALAKNQLTGQPVDLQDAFDEFANLLSAASRQARPAPRVMPTGGGLPGAQPTKRVSEMSQEERFAVAGDIINRFNTQ